MLLEATILVFLCLFLRKTLFQTYKIQYMNDISFYERLIFFPLVLAFCCSNKLRIKHFQITFNAKLSEQISFIQIVNPILILRFLIIFIQQFKQSLESHPQEGTFSIWSEKSLIVWEHFPKMRVTRWI